MILIDAGPMYLLTDQQRRLCGAARTLLRQHSGSLCTTAPAIVEAMYLCNRAGKWELQRLLWDLLLSRAIHIVPIVDEDYPRMRALMHAYNDLPMDFADASLVAVAERLGYRQIITVDRDFFVYRINDREAFDVIRLAE